MGIVALTLGLFFNLQYALIDYGMHDNTLGTQLTAQTNGGGGNGGGSTDDGGGSSDDGGGSSDDGGGTDGEVLWVRQDFDCTYTFTGKAGAKITVFGGTIITIGADGTASYTEEGGRTTCTRGGEEQCTARYCRALT